MGDKISGRSKYEQLVAGGAGREALVNPNTNLETFKNSLGLAATGAAEGVGNIFANILDVGIEGRDADIFENLKKLKKKKYGETTIPLFDAKIQLPRALDLAIDVGKLPFQDADPEFDNAIESARKSSIAESKRLESKDILGAQYAGGGAGRIAGELVKALPIFKFGTMSKTNAILKSGGNSIDMAKAVSIDTLRNIGSMSASEVALSKFYGESDKEAIEKGLIAGATAGLGTPVIAGTKALGKKVFKVADTLEEEVTSMAGGGKPPTVKPSTTDRKIMKNVKVDAGEKLPKQKDVTTPEVKKFDTSFDDKRGRQYSDSWLNNYQGKSTDKASTIKLPEGEIKDVDSYVNSMKRSFKSHLDTKEAFGSTEAKFKTKGSMTSTEKLQAEKVFEKDLMFSLSKDGRLGLRDKRLVKAKAKSINEALKDTREFIPKDLKEKTEISYANQKIEYKTPLKHNVESAKQFDIWKKDNTGYDEGTYTGFNKEFDSNAKPKQIEILTKTVEDKLDKKEFVNTVDDITTSMKLKGETFDIDNISSKVKNDYQSEIHKVTNFMNRTNDLEQLKNGDISPREFSFRESKRLDNEFKRDNLVDGKFKNIDELISATELKSKAYSDIGLHKPQDIITKKKDSNGVSTDTVFADKTDYKKLDSQIGIKNKAMTAYRKDGTVNRYATGDRIGEPVLTDAQIRDIDEFGDILSDKQILDKTMPRVSEAEKLEVTKLARESAKSKVKSGQYKKLGIDFSMMKPFIKSEHTVLDVKNSMGQIAAVITGSKDFAKQVFVKGDAKEFRELLAEKMSKDLGVNLSKKDVKTPVMITGYGSMRKGTTKAVMDENPWLKTEADANKFLDSFYEEFAKLAPELDELMKVLRDVHAGRPSNKATYEWTMPDGYKVRFDLNKYQDYVIKDSRGKRLGIAKARTESIDRMSRALLPNVFHSIDGYIARQMRDRMKIHSTHDAWHVPAGREAEAEIVYRDVLKEMNKSNIMSDIFEDLGYKGWKKTGELSDDMFSADRKLLDTEHVAGIAERAEASKQTPTKQMTESEVMREFMTQSSHRNHQHFKMIDAMVDESVQSTHNLGIARSGDDVYERALAYAMQGKEFDKTKMIEPPKSSKLKTDAWYAEQTGIFNEFRAKAEFHPDLVDTIKGERKYFTKYGEVIGSSIRSKRQVAEETLRNLKLEEKRLNNRGSDVEMSTQKKLRIDNDVARAKAKAGKSSEVTDNEIEKLVAEVKNFETIRLTDDEIKAMDSPKGWKDKYVKLGSDAMFHVTEKYKDTKSYKQYQKLLGTFKNPAKAAEQAGDNLTEYVDDLLKGEDSIEWAHKLFETDARVLREFKTRNDADKFFLVNRDLYERATPAINQLAKAIGREEHQIGHFVNNAKAIAEKYGIPANRIDDLDKIISIKAMEQNKAWDFYELHHGTERFNSLMDIADSQFQRSSSHFKHEKSLNKQVKGYLAEHYDGGKQITPDGKVIYDAESKFETGALGVDMTKNKVGRVDDTKIDENMFTSEAQMIDFAEKNNLKITDKGWRKIPSAQLKDKAGRDHSLSQRLGATESSIEGKTAQHASVVKMLTDEGAYDSMFSKTAKDGFTAVSKEQTDRMPFIMKDEVKFVNTKYVDKLLGKSENRLIRENATQLEKVADRAMSNMTTLFKQAVVLKNPASYKSAFLVNFTTNLLVDPNIVRASKNATKSFKAFKEYSELTRKFDLAKAKGETEKYKVFDHKTKSYKSGTRTKYATELENNELQKYIDLGLSINTLDGVRGQSSMLSYMASDITGNRLDKIGNELLLNQRGNTGHITKTAFSYIDFQGRYMAIKSLENNGLSSADAVRRANDMFGQMDDMAPALIQMVDKYGALVFAKWLASVAPSIAKASVNNPKKALALTLGLYYMSDITDIMFSNVSPVEGTLDMAISGAGGDGWIWNEKFGTSMIPGVYRDLWKQSAYTLDDTQHWHEGPALLFKDRLEPWTTKEGEVVDHRGITQRGLDLILKEQ